MKNIIFLASLFVLTACGAEVKSKDYYLENIQEANQVSEQCSKKQGSKQDQNCINANDAIYQNDMMDMING